MKTIVIKGIPFNSEGVSRGLCIDGWGMFQVDASSGLRPFDLVCIENTEGVAYATICTQIIDLGNGKLIAGLRNLK
jgi:hypothetical protein